MKTGCGTATVGICGASSGLFRNRGFKIRQAPSSLRWSTLGEKSNDIVDSDWPFESREELHYSGLGLG
jgi:hypothetical protein